MSGAATRIVALILPKDEPMNQTLGNEEYLPLLLPLFPQAFRSENNRAWSIHREVLAGMFMPTISGIENTCSNMF